MINFNLTSIFDILIGLLLLGTASPVPEWFAKIHAYFLIGKGGFFLLPLPRLTALTPLLIIGGGADILSASILLIGEPPLLADFKIYIAGFLYLKGLISMIGFL